MKNDNKKKQQSKVNTTKDNARNGTDATKITSSEEELLKRLEEMEAKVLDSETKLKSVLADYQNMLREVEKQRLFITDMIKKEVFSDLIELFTDLYISIEQLPENVKDDSHVQGLTRIVLKYRDLLKKHNVTELNFKEGDVYDPSKAEVIGIIPDEEKNGIVSVTVQPGYAVNGVLIKPARVMIFKKN